ncbi:MAG: sensor histidine kinase, partial [Bacteroidetes bacterium]
MQKNKLYWKISATLLALLVVLGVTYVMITGYVARQYHQEINQQLYGNIAPSMAHEVNPFVEGGGIDTVAIHHIMHSMMTINPSVEVYLLDTVGNIITYVAPYKRVKLESVALGPVNEFIAAEEKPFIKGDNPRFPGQQSVFSAARIEKEGALQGYFYIVLASEEQSAIVSTLSGSYMLKLGANMFFITLFGALAIGLLAIWLLTKNLRSIIHSVKRFKEGDLQARIAEDEKGDLTELADTFNEMADTIVDNIDQLKSVEKLRRELIANVSHDLRTPVSIIQGYVETLMIKKETIKENDQERYLKIILDSTEKLSAQIGQ